MNYSNEQVIIMRARYLECPTRQTVDALAEEFETGFRSVIGKLSKEGIYRREGYKTKTGETPITKIELVSIISQSVGLEMDDLQGLEKSPKAALKRLTEVLE
jgi:hypothetical protein